MGSENILKAFDFDVTEFVTYCSEIVLLSLKSCVHICRLLFYSGVWISSLVNIGR